MVRGGNAHFFTYTRIRSRETGENKTDEQTRTNLGLTKSRGRYCNTICMCGLSLAWVTSENSTMLLESDSSWLTLAGPYPMLPRLSAPVSGVDCPCPWIHANFSFCRVASSTPACVQRQLPSAACLSALQPPTALSWVASSTPASSGSPFPLPDTARFHVQESFVWFRAKTDSSALAAYPHNATD